MARKKSIERDWAHIAGGKEQDPSPARKIALLIFCLTLVLIAFFWAKVSFSSLFGSLFESKSFEFINTERKAKGEAKSAAEVTKNLEELAATLRGEWGVYVYSFESDSSYGFGYDKAFIAASVNKLPIMLAFYRAIENGDFSPDSIYRLSARDVQAYGTGSMRYQRAGTTYSYLELLELCGKKSDNTAAYVLAEILGKPNLEKFNQALGLTKTSIEENLTTPQEAGQLFVKTYRGEILKTEKYQNTFFESLTDTEFEDRIPAGLPKGTRVAHKIGSEERIYNDCGVVFAANPFVLCIFSAETGETDSKIFFPEAARMVWDFEQG